MSEKEMSEIRLQAIEDLNAELKQRQDTINGLLEERKS